MKLQYKSGLVFTIFGIITLVIMAISYNIVSHQIVIKKEMNKIQALSDEVALHMQSHLIEKTLISTTLASAPVIKKALEVSNEEFLKLTLKKRNERISSLNKKWIESKNNKDAFIQKHLTNEVANYLIKQQFLFPEEYGEIFLTNKYGVMISTTAKLTTLAHSQKYWWKAAYNEGKGKIFLDDRGYDTSSKSVVLGVVIPIKSNNEIIGILKSNVNIIGPLTDVIREVSERYPGEIKIARTNGLIISDIKNEPLSKSLSDIIIKHLQSRIPNTFNNSKNKKEFIVSTSPIKITLGSENIGFGGSTKSIDHIMGNKDEAWHIVTTLDKESSLEGVHSVIYVIVTLGSIFIFLMMLLASFFGRIITIPIKKLLYATNEIGLRKLDTKVNVKSKDEIGELGDAVNKMTKNLKNTMASKKELEDAYKKILETENALKDANIKLQAQTMEDGLTGIQNRRSFDLKLPDEFNRMKRSNKELSLVIMDIDYFKKYNDRYGHQAGDDCLRLVARTAERFLRRPGDFFGRYGGEEFVALLPNTPSEGARSITEKINHEISKLKIEHKDSLVSDHITLSSGIATVIPSNSITKEQLLKNADDSLYRAKSEGRNRVIIYNDS